MKLTALEAEPSFALLGPGFTGGSWRLLRDLYPLPPQSRSTGTRPAAPVSGAGETPRLIYTPFEAASDTPRLWGSHAVEDVVLESEGDLCPGAPLLLALSASRETYATAVSTIRRSIAAGDVYQVCLTLRAQLAETSGAQLFALLNGSCAARFSAWVKLPGGTEIVSASPELFFETTGAQVRAEPMKGTARYGEGRLLEDSEKDRAELAMITDLVRNDLTPVCRSKSVRVPCARRMIALPYACQTVSDVVGHLLPGFTPIDVLEALHPGGSVTGTPKQAALAMIRQLEPTPRGPYCGALGLWQGDRARVSLLIRTAYRNGGQWTYGVGSGIVYDSKAETEWTELITKLGALGQIAWAATPACA